MKKANEFYENKNYELTIKECQKAVDKDSLNAEAYLLMGKSYRAMNKIDQAITAFKTAFLIKPNSSITNKAKLDLIQAKLFEADMALKEKDYNVAFSQYKDVLELDSTDFRANYQLGLAYEENRWLDKAKDYYDKAILINSAETSILKRLATIDSLTQLAETNFKKGKRYYVQRKNNSAARYLKLAINYKDDFKEAKYYFNMARGKILNKKGNKGQLWDAIEAFGKAMILKPDLAEPHYFLGICYEKKDRNEFDNAINEFKIAIEKEPNGRFASSCRKKIKELKNRRDKLKKFWGK
jgi:tetratricopeptide (TPR) repeat protein